MGHKVGIEKIHDITDDCLEEGIKVLTLYVFSTENWSRPESEVNFLMLLAEQYARREVHVLEKKGVKLQLMGDPTGIPSNVLNAVNDAVRATANNTNMYLNLAFNYGGRNELVLTTRKIALAVQNGRLKVDEISEQTVDENIFCPEIPPVDLVIRTSGEMRTSNFMIWRAANAIFISSPVLWPDFTRADLEDALELYSKHWIKENQIHE